MYQHLSNSAIRPYIIFTIKINQTTFIINFVRKQWYSQLLQYTYTFTFIVFKKVEFLHPGYMKSFSQTETYFKHTVYKTIKANKCHNVQKFH
jgi:hypothetical protein